MKLNSLLRSALVCLALVVMPGVAGQPSRDLEVRFRTPPADARPWVYLFPLDGNLSSNGITADLEAMARVGIGGLLYMETDQGAPPGPARYGDPLWRAMFQHICAESRRLGLEVNMNNDAGWNGSGGPWITPEMSMQKVTWSETNFSGPTHFSGALLQPPTVEEFYQDTQVLAFPAKSSDKSHRIGNIEGKALFGTGRDLKMPSTFPTLPAAAVIEPDRIVNLTSKLGPGGVLEWDVPAGEWTVVRFGHTSTGRKNHPAPLEGRGLECDKLSKAAAELHFNALMGRLIKDNAGLVGEGRTLVSTHIDSWEIGSQNWTHRLPEEFLKKRGYDLTPFLPVFTGRVVGGLEVSERFLWDLRQTVNELVVDNYAGHMRELAHRSGMRLSIEAYDGPCDDLTYAGRADEPMAEFWSWAPYGFAASCTEMASAAHVYGRPILGAEAFTANKEEKWQGHPYSIKAYGDWAFCEGINRFVFHRYALQPWTNPDRAPGMSMGPWGLHYERGQTWWEQSRAWHEYLSRCQTLLREGLFVADICYLAPERSPQRWQPPHTALERPAYNFDGCPAEVLFTRMSVKNGRLALPDGMSYRVLVLPDSDTMTPRLLERIAALIKDGATVIGTPPVKSPSLQGYPECDQQVAALAAKLWPGFTKGTPGENVFGKGKVVWGRSTEEVLGGMGVKPDFVADMKTAGGPLRYIHRRTDDADIYFVASKEPVSARAVCSFRVDGRQPELWRPDTGHTQPVAVYEVADGLTKIPLSFEPAGSVFVVFRGKTSAPKNNLIAVRHNGATLLNTDMRAPQESRKAATPESPAENFAFAVWAWPSTDITLPKQARGGTQLDAIRNDALYPAPGHETGWGDGQAGAGLSAGTNGICVFEHGDHHFAPVLVHKAELTNWTHITVVYSNGFPLLYLNGQFASKGLKSDFEVHSSVGAVHRRQVPAFKGQLGKMEGFNSFLDGARVAGLVDTMPKEAAPPPPAPFEPEELAAEFHVDAKDRVTLLARQSGTYELQRSRGKPRMIKVGKVPEPIELSGPWQVTFDPKWGGPATPVRFDTLTDWAKRPEDAIRFYSGTAVYRKTFTVPVSLLARDMVVHLDLGKVAVMAEVKLNGRDLGILWKPPFRVEVSKFLQPGENILEAKIVNLWINRQIGDEHLPEDSDRKPEGTLTSWPQWLQEGKPSPTGRYTFTSWRLWKKEDALSESGLLGPVTLRPARQVPIR